MNVSIQTIPHSVQRYDTVGDWWWDGDTLEIRVSDMGNWKYEMAVAHHEEREALHCKALGVEEKDVTAFDMKFEENRVLGTTDEPGDDPNAPYYIPHQYATREEVLFLRDLGEEWSTYEEHVNSL